MCNTLQCFCAKGELMRAGRGWLCCRRKSLELFSSESSFKFPNVFEILMLLCDRDVALKPQRGRIN
jgi:hypothetical protein